MELMDLATGAVSVAGGGLFGLLGSIGSSLIKGRNEGKKREHELKVLKAQSQLATVDHQQNMAESRQEMSSQGLVASIQADVVAGISTWAANVKALYRPGLTTLLLMTCVYIFYMLLQALEGQNALSEVFPRDEIIEMIRYTVYSLVFSTATAITWWFGDRALSPPHQK